MMAHKMYDDIITTDFSDCTHTHTHSLMDFTVTAALKKRWHKTTIY